MEVITKLKPGCRFLDHPVYACLNCLCVYCMFCLRCSEEFTKCRRRNTPHPPARMSALATWSHRKLVLSMRNRNRKLRHPSTWPTTLRRRVGGFFSRHFVAKPLNFSWNSGPDPTQLNPTHWWSWSISNAEADIFLQKTVFIKQY